LELKQRARQIIRDTDASKANVNFTLNAEDAMSLETIKNIAVKSFWEPFQKNPLLVGVLLGVAMLVLSVLVQSLWPPGVHPVSGIAGWALSGAGTAILGTGVFTAIVKSSQFAEIFQVHVMDALYSPNKIHTTEQLRQSWMSLTKAMLDRALGSDAEKTARKIHETFLNSDLELSHTYHGVNISYDIDVDATGNATITNTLNATLKVPLGVDSPTFSQWLKTDGAKKLTYLRIGNHEVDLNTEIPPAIPNGSGELTLSYPLAGHLDDARAVEVERTFEISQNLRVEPFITIVIEKYVFGMEVRVRVKNDYQIIYIKSGKRQNNADILKDGKGFFRWVIAPAKTLLWPGSGFTLILTK
jgi:hypothetical protein